MKKIARSVSIVLFLTVAVVTLSACVAQPTIAPQNVIGQTLVALPQDAKDLILALVTAGIAWLLLKINMGQFTQPIAAAVAPLLVAVFEQLLGLIVITPSLDGVILAVLHWLVLLVSGSVGAFLLFKRAPQPKSLLQ